MAGVKIRGLKLIFKLCYDIGSLITNVFGQIMILIAHRGNINGIDGQKENHPDYLLLAQKLGYNVEVDVWQVKGRWFLGHDEPTFPINDDFFKALNSQSTWYHAKNPEALYSLLQKQGIHVFWHQEDNYTLTSKGYIWVHTKTELLPKNSICVLPEVRLSNNDIEGCAAICSDCIANYKKVI